MSNVLELNQEIIRQEVLKKNFPYNGNNIRSFMEWSESGYKIIKGQNAFIKTRL